MMVAPSNFIVGAMLAGGHGARLGGVDKALLQVGGQSLISRLSQSLESQCNILAAVSPRRFDGKWSWIADPGEGPAEAIVSALGEIHARWPNATHVLTASVDSYFFPANFAQGALGEMSTTGASVVTGRFGAQDYPVNALWALEETAFSALAPSTGNRGRAVRALLDGLNVAHADYSRPDGKNPFANINTVGDLITAERHFLAATDAGQKSADAAN
ncbi:MAG: NTP transferase domain-containing protein [Hyphomicrobiaceae bacterium]|nr:NTP transferase domain-containing protein [Hyphomicrobiaceae bacterium]